MVSSGYDIKYISLWVVGALLAGFVVYLWLHPAHQDPQPLLAQFKASPTQSRAEQLAALIDTRKFSPKDGALVLEALFKPNVIARDSYAEGKPPMFDLEFPYSLWFSNVSIRKEITGCIPVSGVTGTYDVQGLKQNTERFSFPGTCTNRGNYTVTVQYAYCAYKIPTRYGIFWEPKKSWVPSFKKRGLYSTNVLAYACSFSVPVAVRVVPQAEAEKIQLAEGPDLEAIMKQRITTKPCPRLYQGSGSLLWLSGGVDLCYTNVPVEVCFKPVISTEAGVASLGECIKIRKGTSGIIEVPYGYLRLKEPGQYSGALRLQLALQEAYEDPSVKRLWNGALEFPVSIQAQRPRQ